MNKNDKFYTRISIIDYVATFIRKINEKEGRVFNLRHHAEEMYMLEFLNDPKYTTFKSMRVFDTDFYGWDKQTVNCVPSNLGSGRGYIFYFRCNGCYDQVKYLYEYSTLHSPLCRRCCGIKYNQPTRKARSLSRIFRKPYLSSEDKYTLIKRAGITREDIPDDVMPKK